MFRIEIDTSGFEEWVRNAIQALEPIEADIANPVEYVPRLEYGSSKQAPHGMVRVSIPEIEAMLVSMIGTLDFEKAARSAKLREALCEWVNMAADFGMGLIRDRTPIRTGNARRNWVVIEAE